MCVRELERLRIVTYCVIDYHGRGGVGDQEREREGREISKCNSEAGV